MKFTKRQIIALNAMHILSELHSDRVMGVKEAAEKLQVNARYLEQLLFVLRKNGFVATKRGVEGGYFLTKKGRDSNADEILSVLDAAGGRGGFSDKVVKRIKDAASSVRFEGEGIYLDNAATTRVDEEVLRKTLPYLTDIYANASSVHGAGRRAMKAVDDARERIAAQLNVKPWEIYFTSGGSESDNWALKGVAEALEGKGRHIITTCVEHPAVLESCRALQRRGFEVTYLPVGSDGIIELDVLKEAIREDTVLISVMAANNETGAIMPIGEVGAIARERGIYFHTDAVQAAGHLDLDAQTINCDLLSLSGHKFYALKGAGVLFKRNNVKCARYADGGEQERGKRAGTLNVPGIVAMGYALEKAYAEREKRDGEIKKMRDIFEKRLNEKEVRVMVLSREERLPSHSCLTFEGVDGHLLAARLDERGVYASVGSACSSGSAVTSHVLLAMGLSKEQARAMVRFSFGKYNFPEQALRAADIVAEEVAALRSTSDLFARAAAKDRYV